jgi:hypothetical protein
MRRIVRVALTASAGALACLVAQSLASRQRAVSERMTKRERKAAVSDWETEGGGLAPSHDPRLR